MYAAGRFDRPVECSDRVSFIQLHSPQKEAQHTHELSSGDVLRTDCKPYTFRRNHP